MVDAIDFFYSFVSSILVKNRGSFSLIHFLIANFFALPYAITQFSQETCCLI